jgi:monoamine oxidase
MQDWDAIVIGGGFAGITAARELGRRYDRVLVLEARDRLGGRTWYKKDALAGKSLELGGTWIHWFQPHVWAELTRYGLDIIESPTPVRSVWFVDGARKEGAYEASWEPLERAIAAFGHDAAELFERPYDPLRSADLDVVDQLSIKDRIDELDLTAQQRALLTSFYCLCASAPTSEGGLTTMLRWLALSNNDPALFFEILAKYKFANGTVSLIDSMAADSGATIRLETAVQAIAQGDNGVTVQTASGDEVTAATVVVTVPLNVLSTIEFTPPLPKGKLRAANAGQASRGFKVWVEIVGTMDEVCIYAPEDAPIAYWQTEFKTAKGQLLVGFGPSGDDFDVEDTESITRAVKDVLPNVEVVGHTAHPWRLDEFSRGTWPVLRPGQLTASLRDLQRPHGSVVFAGSETADGWNGYIDGAIETGFRAASEVRQILSNAASQ